MRAIWIGFKPPAAWLNKKRLIIGGMALAMTLGRLLAGSAGYLAYALPANVAFPKAFIYGFAPFLLLLTGIIVIVAIASTPEDI